MRLGNLILPGDRLEAGGPDLPVSGIFYDSRKDLRGGVFFALPGARTDGDLHASEALRKGAAAVVSRSPAPADLPSGTAWARASDITATFSHAASEFHGRPSEKLKVVGVTGTNGKTTVTYMLESVFSRLGMKPGVIGTVNYRIGGEVVSSAPNTTPMAPELHSLLAQMVSCGSYAAVMEVSSHSLALGRADSVKFDCAVFTNLQSDHLDFHKDRGNYLSAKLRLFALTAASGKEGRSAVVNADEPAAAEVARAAAGAGVLTYALDRPADISAAGPEYAPDGVAFTLRTPAGEAPVKLRLPGRHNLYNALAAAGAAHALGVSPADIAAGLEALEKVPGRLEPVRAGQDFSIFVDYAHTADALESVLGSLRGAGGKKLITVFGCGGDRDRTKRAPMGRAACSLSDRVFITSDNPRTEDPAAIIAEIEAGVKGKFSNYEVIPDRRAAIRAAVAAASYGDIVLIAGKGHEDYQVIGRDTVHFSDCEEAALAVRSGNRAA
ncbi:MAG TPA: UDP-N-acetylmuramoyl-L-alanyl-D-glutamate--2,6-diaminopimelate ligase [Elusimicrobiales bacterium]|nr:UDP-N-acetylmuramoyl-L-alanyl-D-glutamate--2,6-diaminopimelate ligase [Elusimicrobiales bacterium]